MSASRGSREPLGEGLDGTGSAGVEHEAEHGERLRIERPDRRVVGRQRGAIASREQRRVGGGGVNAGQDVGEQNGRIEMWGHTVRKTSDPKRLW